MIEVPTAEKMLASLAGIAADGHPVDTPIADLLTQRRFNPGITPPPIRSVYTLAGHTIATPGNLVAITSAIKTGKSAVIGGMAASVMVNSVEADALGFRSDNPKSHALLHFDSEQSPDDHWHQVNRMLRRAGVNEPPAWFRSYCLTGLPPRRILECVREALRIAAEEHGGIHSSLIDGVADLVNDVNDSGECNAFVAELHGTAIEHDCPIVGVIHFNPGGEKVRGHLGSQLERKAETNLRLDKADGVTCVWSEKQRRAPITKEAGPRFRWDNEAGLHVSCETAGSIRHSEKIEKLRCERDDVFNGRPAMRYGEMVKGLSEVLGMSDRTAERHVGDWRKFNLVRKEVGSLWVKVE